MAGEKRPKVAIVGAGLAGSLMAICLARRGHEVEVYERRGDPRTGSPTDGRSINLGLSHRGIRALDHFGLLQEVLERTVPMRGRVVHRAGGALAFQPYGTTEAQILHSVLREDLNRILLARASALPGVTFFFDTKLVRFDKDAARPTCDLLGPDGERQVEVDLVVGADGAFSAVRTQLNLGEPADYHQEFLPWGYKELAIPKGRAGELRTDPESLHVWPGHDGMIVSHPNTDHSLTATLFLPHTGPGSFAEVATPEQVRAMFTQRFPDLLGLVPDAVEQYLANPVGRMVTVRTSRWQHQGRVVLVGDAAHAVYPFYGQGMNSAFEDCLTLDGCFQRHGVGDRALREFQELRKPHTDVLAQLSKQNFDELRDRLASPLFVARKKADLVLNRLLPKRWIPLYTLIAHTTTPYADALRRSQRQHAVLTGLGGLAAAGIASAGYALLGRAASQRKKNQRRHHPGGK